MLSEKIRNCDFTWDDAKTKLKKDHRWDQVADYDRDEMERLFSSHMGTGSETQKKSWKNFNIESDAVLARKNDDFGSELCGCGFSDVILNNLTSISIFIVHESF